MCGPGVQSRHPQPPASSANDGSSGALTFDTAKVRRWAKARNLVHGPHRDCATLRGHEIGELDLRRQVMCKRISSRILLLGSLTLWLLPALAHAATITASAN